MKDNVLEPNRKPQHKVYNDAGTDIDRHFKAILDRYYADRQGETGGTGTFYTEDLTSQITGINSHFTLTHTATYKVVASCNLEQSPDSIIMDADMKGFNFSFIPTTRDVVIVGYFK